MSGTGRDRSVSRGTQQVLQHILETINSFACAVQVGVQSLTLSKAAHSQPTTASLTQHNPALAAHLKNIDCNKTRAVCCYYMGKKLLKY